MKKLVMPSPTLVLLPGLDGTGLLFQPLLDALPTSLPTVVVAYPTDQVLAYEELLPQVLAAMPGDTPFILLGESFSGPLALMAAARRPAGLAGVVLCASFYRSPHPWLPHGISQLVRPALLRMFPMFSQVKALVGGYATPALRLLVREAISRVSPEVLACRIREVLRVDTSTSVTECPVPLLILQGTRDWVVPPWNARGLQRLLPATTLQLIDAPHLVLQTQPHRVAAAVVEFANGCMTNKS